MNGGGGSAGWVRGGGCGRWGIGNFDALALILPIDMSSNFGPNRLDSFYPLYCPHALLSTQMAYLISQWVIGEGPE